MGASLGAFVHFLGSTLIERGYLGYRLVGCIKEGYHSFFLRNDVGVLEFEEVSGKSCFLHHDEPTQKAMFDQRYQVSKNFKWDNA